jgi:Tfp pilus assembly protein PilX
MLPTPDTAHRDPRPSAARSGEAGYVLTEVLLVSTLLFIVLGAVLMFGDTSQRIAPKETERAIVIRDAQVGMHRMTRELREAHSVVSPAAGVSAAVFDAWVPTTSSQRRVSYECNVAHPTDAAYTQCVRYDVSAAGVKSNAQVVVDRVLNGAAGSTLPVFVRGSSPTADYVKTTVEVASRGDRKTGHNSKILLEDGFYMRNLDG